MRGGGAGRGGQLGGGWQGWERHHTVVMSGTRMMGWRRGAASFGEPCRKRHGVPALPMGKAQWRGEGPLQLRSGGREGGVAPQKACATLAPVVAGRVRTPSALPFSACSS